MSGLHLCTDSSALLSEDEADRLGVTVVPVHVALEGEPFDGSTDHFYDRVTTGARATTAAPSPGVLLGAYRAAAARGASEVLSLHLDARVSSTVAAAELAARRAPIPVAVIDTLTASFGVALCVRAAADAVSRGARADEAVEIVRGLGWALRNVFVIGEGSGGRVGSVAGWTTLRLADGRSQHGATCASPDDAVLALKAEILDSVEPVNVAVGHAAAQVESWADELARRVAEASLVARVERYRVGPPVGAHTGPLSFGAFWWPARAAP